MCRPTWYTYACGCESRNARVFRDCDHYRALKDPELYERDELCRLLRINCDADMGLGPLREDVARDCGRCVEAREQEEENQMVRDVLGKWKCNAGFGRVTKEVKVAMEAEEGEFFEAMEVLMVVAAEEEADVVRALEEVRALGEARQQEADEAEKREFVKTDAEAEETRIRLMEMVASLEESVAEKKRAVAVLEVEQAQAIEYPKLVAESEEREIGEREIAEALVDVKAEVGKAEAMENAGEAARDEFFEAVVDLTGGHSEEQDAEVEVMEGIRAEAEAVEKGAIEQEPIRTVSVEVKVIEADEVREADAMDYVTVEARTAEALAGKASGGEVTGKVGQPHDDEASNDEVVDAGENMAAVSTAKAAIVTMVTEVAGAVGGVAAIEAAEAREVPRAPVDENILGGTDLARPGAREAEGSA